LIFENTGVFSMPRPASSSTALPIAVIVLRTLIVSNWLAEGTLMRDDLDGTV
jgi:hypothetical protein